MIGWAALWNVPSRGASASCHSNRHDRTACNDGDAPSASDPQTVLATGRGSGDIGHDGVEVRTLSSHDAIVEPTPQNRNPEQAWMSARLRSVP